MKHTTMKRLEELKVSRNKIDKKIYLLQLEKLDIDLDVKPSYVNEDGICVYVYEDDNCYNENPEYEEDCQEFYTKTEYLTYVNDKYIESINDLRLERRGFELEIFELLDELLEDYFS